MSSEAPTRCVFRKREARKRAVKGCFAHVAQSAEHVLGKDGVSSSILLVGSILTHNTLSRRSAIHVQAEV